MNHAFLKSLLLIALVVLSASCAQKRIVLKEDITIEGSPSPLSAEEKAFLKLSARQLFDRGFGAFDTHQYALALKHFDRILDAYPDHDLVPDAAYNAGLIYEKSKNYDLAAERFARAEETVPLGKHRDLRDARFRLLYCLMKLERWPEIEQASKRTLQDPGLEDDDRVQAKVLWAVSLWHQKRYQEAAENLEPTFRDYRYGIRLGTVFDEFYGAMAAFYLGEEQARLFDQVPVREKSILLDLEQKARHLMQGQHWYHESIKQNNGYWATKAAFKIGLLYESFFNSFMDSPMPSNLTEADEQEAYRCVVSNKFIALVRKSIRIYDRGVAMSQRIGVQNDATQAMVEHLNAMKERYIHEQTRCEIYKDEKWLRMLGLDPETAVDTPGKPSRTH